MTLKPTTLFLVALVISCTQEEIIVKEYARLGEVVVETQAIGAMFSAHIIKPGGEPVIQHGFEWGTASAGGELIGIPDKVNLGPLEGIDFTAKVNRSIEKNKNYVVRAFVETEKFRVVSSWTTFLGTGSASPVIAAFTPFTATWGDTLEITGSHFSFNREIVKVFFSGEPGIVTVSTDALIKVVVPVFTDTTQVILAVSIGGHTRESGQPFTLLPIEVSSVTPTSVKSQTMVTVTGANMLPSGNRVFVAGTELSATAYLVNNAHELQFKVPNLTPAGNVQLKIVSGALKKVIENAFTRLSPVITSVVPTEVFEGETITIKGTNFGDGYSDNSAQIGEDGMAGQITRIAPGEMDVVLPVMASLDLVVTADYVSTATNNVFTIKKPVITSVTQDVIYPGQNITIEGDYLAAGSSGTLAQIGGIESTLKTSAKKLLAVEMPLVREFESPVVVTSFGKTSNSDMSVTSPVRTMQLPGPTLFHGTAFSIGTVGYVVAVDVQSEVNSSLGNVVWKYDQAADQWTRLDDFPGEMRSSPLSFSMNGKGYLLGGQGLTSVLKDLWEFDPATEEWTRLNDCPIWPSTVNTVDGGVFALSMYSPQKMWSYDAATDGWTDKGDLPLEVREYHNPVVIGLTIGNRLFFGFTEQTTHLYEYALATGAWISKGDVDIGYAPVAFDYNDVGLLLTLDGKLRQYQPTTNTLSTLEENLVNYFNFQGQSSVFSVGNRRYFGLGYLNRYTPINDKNNINLFFELDCQRAGF